MWKVIGILFALGLVVKFLELLADILIVAAPLLIITIFAAALFWICWRIAIHNYKKKKQIPSNLDALLKKTGDSSSSSKQELAEFLGENNLIRSFHTRIVGVSYDNDDGSSRQEILSQCLRGEPLGLYWHTFEGKPACAVISDHGQIGYLNAELADDLNYNYADERYSFVSHISDITGGEDGLYYGCIILISIYESTEV